MSARITSGSPRSLPSRSNTLVRARWSARRLLRWRGSPDSFVKRRKGSKPEPVEQAVVKEIDRPGLVCCQWLRAHHAQMTQPFASPPSAQGQPLLAIQPLDAFVVRPASPRGAASDRASDSPSGAAPWPTHANAAVIRIAIFPRRPPESAPRNPDKPTSATLRQTMSSHYFRHHLTLHCGP